MIDVGTVIYTEAMLNVFKLFSEKERTKIVKRLNKLYSEPVGDSPYDVTIEDSTTGFDIGNGYVRFTYFIRCYGSVSWGETIVPNSKDTEEIKQRLFEKAMLR
jgi:hypothetical protein